MKTDTYTKIVLTVIAVALTANLLKGLFTTHAQATPLAGNNRMMMLPVNADGTIDVNIRSINEQGFAFSSSAPIPVVIKR